jgi:peroxiredoxin (alkyl hydroperoxide reductase subunit C)
MAYYNDLVNMTGLKVEKSKGLPRSFLKTGVKAPDFSLKSTSNKNISLKDYLGRTLILLFYPADFSPTCSDELPLYSELVPEFRRFNAEVAAISVDNTWSHLAFARDRNLSFPLLSDFEPKGKVSREYGVYQKETGHSGRAIFLIDGEGIIRWSYVVPNDVNPGADGVLKALEEMK